MKKTILLIAIMAVLSSAYAQPIHYTSTAQIEELTANATFLTFEIIFDDADDMVKVIDPDNGQVFFTYQVKYEKTTKDNESTIKWYKIYQSPKFNVFKVCKYNQPLKIKSKVYNYNLIFSRYNGNTRMNDFGFLANKTK